MSNKSFSELSFEERRQLASDVKRLRQEAGMTQIELADYAGITRQALGNIERGSVPQADNLRRIYDVLGVDLETVGFSEETTQWLTMLGGIIENLQPRDKARVGHAALVAATQELIKIRSTAESHGALSDLEFLREASRSRPLSRRERRELAEAEKAQLLESQNVGGLDEDVDIPENVEEVWGLAAHPKTDAPEDHTP